MKHKQKILGFISGVLVTALFSTCLLPAMAALVEQKITVYTGVKVYVDDVKIDAGDTHGNPDAFAYNGTTYVALAAISKSLGESVIWDSASKSVYVGKHAGDAAYLLNVCPPYQSKGLRNPATFMLAGEKYANGFTLGGYSNVYALFNLNGRYDTLSFDIGHIDGEDMTEAALDIYLDGDLMFSLDLEPEMMVEHYEIPLDGAIQMKVVSGNGNGDLAYYALTNVKVS